MTEEEKLAEEYADKSKPNFVVNEYGSTVYTRLDIEQAFLAGLKVGKPQWHNTEETPPEDKKYKGCSIIVLDENCTKIHKYENRWFEDISGNETYPLAWCELPKYEKE